MRHTTITLALSLFSAALIVSEAIGYQYTTNGRGDMCAAETVHIPRSPNLMVFADRSGSMREPSDLGQQTTQILDPRLAGKFDIGLKPERADAADNLRKRPGLSLSQKVVVPPYAWIVNHNHGTVSKFNVETHKEEGRFSVGNNPSRTAVDLDGNAWITTRGDGMVTKILWNSSECPDKNGNGVITTSTGTNVVAGDECIVFQQRTRPGWTIRGVAAGPDGRVWIGYSSAGGAIQSINSSTFALGPIVMASKIPLFRANKKGVFVRQGNQTAGGCENYGLVLDAQGLLYYSSWCFDRLPVFDTKTNRWIAAYYTPGDQSMYGITVDAESRIWMGAWPNRSGVEMFDPKTKRMHHFPVPNQGGINGLAAEPETGDIWGVFSNSNNVGRLRFNKTNYSQYSWTIIPGPRWGGVGFDAHGFAWAVGNGNNELYKLDPATSRRHTSLPNGAPVGQGSHYAYSDFTGSTALSFTAPSGKWSHIQNTGTSQVLSITVEAHVPFGTTLGLRYRTVDANGNPTSAWTPAPTGGAEVYHQYPPGTGCIDNKCQSTTSPTSMRIQIPQPNDNPFIPGRIQLEARLGTSSKGIRPYLYAVSLETVPTGPLFVNSQNVAADMSNSFSIDGSCAGDDGSGCDIIRVGLAYFNDTVDTVADVGENTSAALSAGIAAATAGGLTGATLVASQIRDTAALQDPERPNYALIITDGKFNTRDDVIAAIGYLCDANRRNIAPVSTYVMGPGGNVDAQMNALFAAAGGTGSCCPANATNCLNQPVDVCAMSQAALAAAIGQSGSSPYTQATVNPTALTCTGGLEMTDITLFKNTMRQISNELACTFKLNIPNDPAMYNNPVYPQIGALPDPRATRVTLDHQLWSLLDVPYCEPGQMDCGFEESLLINGVAASTAASFADEGWYFATADRSQIRLTEGLCNQVAQRKIQKTRTQVACQCKYDDGETCVVEGELGRCSVGASSCMDGVDTCIQIFRPMPETCNGLDDNCDGGVDNLADSGPDWTTLGGVPNAYAGIQCSFIDVCICRSKDNEHAGSGATVQQEFTAFLKVNSTDNSCYCGEGLAMSQGEEVDLSSDPADPDQGTGCSVQSGAGNSGLILGLLGMALLWVRRR